MCGLIIIQYVKSEVSWKTQDIWFHFGGASTFFSEGMIWVWQVGDNSGFSLPCISQHLKWKMRGWEQIIRKAISVHILIFFFFLIPNLATVWPCLGNLILCLCPRQQVASLPIRDPQQVLCDRGGNSLCISVLSGSFHVWSACHWFCLWSCVASRDGFSSVLFKLYRRWESPGDLVTMQILLLWFWRGVWTFHFQQALTWRHCWSQDTDHSVGQEFSWQTMDYWVSLFRFWTLVSLLTGRGTLDNLYKCSQIQGTFPIKWAINTS